MCREIRQPLQAGFAPDRRLEDGSPTRAQDIADDTGQFETGVLKRLLDPHQFPLKPFQACSVAVGE